MKKRITAVGMAALMFGTGLVNSSCFGNFSLIRGLYTWNQGIAGDDIGGRFVKTLLFYAMSIIPVYGIAGLIDMVILNLVEFWTGSNPLAMAPGEMEEQLVEYNGKTFKIMATQNRFSFTEITAEGAVHAGDLVFNADNYSWNFEKGNELTELYRIKPQANGNHLIEYTNQEGNLAYASMKDLEVQYSETLASK